MSGVKERKELPPIILQPLKAPELKGFDVKAKPAIETGINGGGNYGNVGDNFQRTSNTTQTPDGASTAQTSSVLDNAGRASTSEEAKSELPNVTGLDVNGTEPVKGAQAEENEAADSVSDAQTGKESAETAAAGGVKGYKAALTTQKEAIAKVSEQTDVVKQDAQAHTEAQRATRLARGEVSIAKTGVATAEAALTTAKALPQPANAAAVTGAEKALAEAKEKLTKAEEALNQAETAETQAKEKLEASKAQLEKDKASLEKADDGVKEAKEKMNEMQKALTTATNLLQQFTGLFASKQQNTQEVSTMTEAQKRETQARLQALIDDLDNSSTNSLNVPGGNNMFGAGEGLAGDASGANNGGKNKQETAQSKNVAQNSANISQAQGKEDNGSAASNPFLVPEKTV